MSNKNIHMHSQKSTRKPSAFSELINAIKHLFRSFSARYSLESYLEVMSEFTDSEILSGIDSGLTFIGGDVTFISSPSNPEIMAIVKLEFQDASKSWKLKKAERKLKKNMFTSETIKRLESVGEMTFDIEKPERK